MSAILATFPKIGVVAPRYEKCCFCIPLKQGLITWGVLQVITVTVITVLGHLMFYDWLRYTLPSEHPSIIICQLITLGFGIVDNAATIAMMRCVAKGYHRGLNWCYNYYCAKLVLFVLLLLLSWTLKGSISDRWYFTNLDPVRYCMFKDTHAVAVLDMVVQANLIFLVRSYIVRLGGVPYCVLKRTQSQRPIKRSQIIT